MAKKNNGRQCEFRRKKILKIFHFTIVLIYFGVWLPSRDSIILVFLQLVGTPTQQYMIDYKINEYEWKIKSDEWQSTLVASVAAWRDSDFQHFYVLYPLGE